MTNIIKKQMFVKSAAFVAILSFVCIGSYAFAQEASTTPETTTTENTTTETGSSVDVTAASIVATNTTTPVTPTHIRAHIVICDDEQYLPDWSGDNVTVYADTASDYVAASNGKCRLEPNWKFQWGYGKKADGTAANGVVDPEGDFYGEAPTSPASTYDAGWKTTSGTNSQGLTHIWVDDIQGTRDIWVRLVNKDGFIAFSDLMQGGVTSVSAETYCNSDVLNYDNFDAVYYVEQGQTYDCISFNAPIGGTPDPITVTCSANATAVALNSQVGWTSTVTGTTGAVTYSWSGTDGLTGTNSYVVKSYSTAGTKNATVTITVDGQTKTANCSVVVNNYTPVNETTMKFYMVVCDAEQYLPDWSGDNVTIGATTASDYVATSNGKCRLEPNWKFQWGYGKKLDNSQPGVLDAGGSYIGEVSNGTGYNSWKTTGVTDNNGKVDVSISTLDGARDLWARVVNKTGFVNFSDLMQGGVTSVSAETYCNSDVLNYDNYDAVYGVVAGNTYHCISFGAPTGGTPTGLSVTCSANATLVALNSNVGWTSNVVNANGPITYSWTGTDGLTGTNSYVVKSYSTSGQKIAYLTVTSNGQTASTQCTVDIKVGGPVDPTLSATCAPNGSSYVVGSTVNWSVHATGGNGNYTYAWSGTDGLSSASSSVSKTYTTTGTKTATVRVTSGTETVDINCTVTINPENNAVFTVSCSANDNEVRINENVTWTATVNNAPGTVTYNWSGTDTLTGSSQTVTKSYSSTGSKNARIEVTANGQTRSAECSTDVVRSSSGGGGGGGSSFRATCSATPKTVKVGEWVEISARGTGGSNYKYDWDGPEGISAINVKSFAYKFESAGTKDIEVTISSGSSGSRKKTAKCPITVEGGNRVAGVFLSQVPYTGLTGNIAFGLFALLLVSVLGGAAYIFIKRKMNLVPAVVYATGNEVAGNMSVTGDIRAYDDMRNAFVNELEQLARSKSASVDAEVVDALYVSSKGNTIWAKSALNQIIDAHVSPTDWKLVSMKSAKTLYPHM